MTPEPEQLLTPREVAVLFRVSPETVTRWAKRGVIPAAAIIRTPGGGHRRFRADAIEAIRRGEPL